MTIEEMKTILSNAQTDGVSLEKAVEMASALEAMEKANEELKMQHAKLKKDYFDLAMKVGTKENTMEEDIEGKEPPKEKTLEDFLDEEIAKRKKE